jgi:WD40 repeat protein
MIGTNKLVLQLCNLLPNVSVIEWLSDTDVLKIMKKPTRPHILLILILLSFQTACSVFSPSLVATQTSTPTLSPIPTLPPTNTPTMTTVPSATPTATLIPTPTSTPTPSLLALMGTPLPPYLAPITLENAPQVSGLAEWREMDVTDLAWASDSQVLAVSNPNYINLYDITTRRILRSLYPRNEGIVNIQFSPTGSWLVAGSRRGDEQSGYASSFELWAGQDMKPLGIIYGVDRALSDMAFSPNGRLFAAAYASPIYSYNAVELWNAQTWSIITNTLQVGTILNLAISPDGSLLATSPDRYAMRIWDLNELQWLYTLHTSFTGAVNVIAFSPDGSTLASGHYDGTIRLWDMRTGEQYLAFETKEVVQSLAFSPDGRVLVTGGSYQDSLVRLWSAGTGALLRTLDGHTKGVTHVLFSPDSQYLVSASYDGLIRLWGIRP